MSGKINRKNTFYIFCSIKIVIKSRANLVKGNVALIINNTIMCAEI